MKNRSKKKKKVNKIQDAISKVFSNPNLPLYIYFSNFNFLVGEYFRPNGDDRANFRIDGSNPKARRMQNLKKKFEKNRIWKQKLRPLKKVDMKNKFSYFDKLKQRIDDNKHNRDALWSLDLRRYFDKNKEEDINNLINRRHAKTEDIKKLEKRTKELEKIHKEIFVKFDKDRKQHSLLRGPPMFYDDQNFENDGLIRFHNAMNRNLFNKRNYKLMKKFYTTNKFFRKKLGEESTKNNLSVESEDEIENNVLNPEQVDYILEQRAYALKNMNDNLKKIQGRSKLKKEIRIEKKEPVLRKFKTRGFRGRGKRVSSHKVLPKKKGFFKNSRFPSTHKKSNRKNSFAPSKTRSSKLITSKQTKSKKPMIPFLDSDVSLKSRLNRSRSRKLHTPSSFRNSFRRNNLVDGFKQIPSDLEINQSEIKTLEGLFKKADSLSKEYRGEELKEKLALCYIAYQKMRENNNNLDEDDNFFMNFKEKYEDPDRKLQLIRFREGIHRNFEDHKRYLNQVVGTLGNERSGGGRDFPKTKDVTFNSLIMEEIGN